MVSLAHRTQLLTSGYTGIDISAGLSLSPGRTVPRKPIAHRQKRDVVRLAGALRESFDCLKIPACRTSREDS